MTVVAAVFTPLVLAYQGWTYYVFRARIKGPAATVPAAPGPLDSSGVVEPGSPG
jgi:cytochrome d ubiquinol oxidase subunit II